MGNIRNGVLINGVKLMTITEAKRFKAAICDQRAYDWDTLTDDQFGFIAGQIIGILQREKIGKIVWTQYCRSYGQLSNFITGKLKIANKKQRSRSLYYDQLIRGFFEFASRHCDESISDSTMHAILLGSAYCE